MNIDFNELMRVLDFRHQPWNTIGVGTVIGILAAFILSGIIKITAKKKDWKVVKTISENLSGVLYLFFPLLVINIIAQPYAYRTHLYALIYGIDKTLLVAVTTWLAARIVIIIEIILIDSLDIKSENNLQARRIYTKIKFIKRIIVGLLVSLGIAVLLLSFDSVRQYGVGIITSAGIASVIVGFAAQKSIANLLAGIQIAFTQPIKIDDVVIVEGEWGRIEEINITYVVVNIWDSRRLVLPITYFIEKPFQNWTRNNSDLIGSAFFQLNYKTPVDKLRNQLEIILDNTPLWDRKSWALQVTDTQEQYMVVRAIMSARNSSEAFDLRCLVRERLIEYIVAEIPEALPVFRQHNSNDGLL